METARRSSGPGGAMAVARTAGWLVLAAILALGGAGLAAQLSHPPGGPNRAELTYAGDRELGARLDEAAGRLQGVAGLVDALAEDARRALAQVNAGEGTELRATLDRGATTAAAIESAVRGLRDDFAAMPGEGPTAELSYSNATLVRRAALLASLDAANAVAADWGRVTEKSDAAARLILRIRDHDETVAAAAAQGVAAHYAQAIETLNHAGTVLDDLVAMRAAFVTSTEVTVLDEWITRHRRYDEALLGLYGALRQSGGKRTDEVDRWYREQTLALAQLPSDNRAVIVIVAQVAQGGLNQAVLSIEDARGRIDDALAGATAS